MRWETVGDGRRLWEKVEASSRATRSTANLKDEDEDGEVQRCTERKGFSFMSRAFRSHFSQLATDIHILRCAVLPLHKTACCLYSVPSLTKALQPPSHHRKTPFRMLTNATDPNPQTRRATYARDSLTGNMGAWSWCWTSYSRSRSITISSPELSLPTLLFARHRSPP